MLALLRRAPAAPSSTEEEPGAALAGAPPPLLGEASFAQALSLIAVVLRYSPMQRQQYLLGGRGLASTTEALQRLPPTYLTSRLVDAAAAVVDALQRSAQTAATAAAEALLFDFRLWQRAAREPTLHLLDIVEGCARRGPPALTAAISAAKLRACYRARDAEVRTAAGRLVAFLRDVPGSEEASAATVAARDAHADGMREQLAARAAAAAGRQREPGGFLFIYRYI